MRKYLALIPICICSILSYSQNVGVGTANPQNKLHVAGGFRLDTLTGVNGAGLLKHDANGVVYGIKFSGNASDVLRGDGTFGNYNVNGSIGWLLGGNNGTNPSTNFLGTTDDQPLIFKVNNIRHGYLGNSIFFGRNAGIGNTISGNIGIGEQSLEKNTSGATNIAIGSYALRNNTTGFYNIGIGYLSLSENTEGTINTAVGNWALSSNTTGHDNTAIGLGALQFNEVGLQNTAVGAYALFLNRSAKNTATGFRALASNFGGDNNTAFGNEALKSNVSGGYNTGVGSFALINNTASGNTGIGAYALYSNTTGIGNTAVGYSVLTDANGYFNSAVGTASLRYNTSGHDNTALGYGALNKNTTASANTSVGAFSMYNNVAGDQNVAVGYKAMEQNTFAVWNTAVGFAALQGNTVSWGNAAFGTNALSRHSGQLGQNSAFGYNALLSNTTGTGNTAVGNQAALNNTTGRYNTAIGFVAAVALPNNVENTTCIGYQTGWNTTISNQVNIGNFSVTWIGGQTGWFHYSDRRIKNDIKEDVPGLSFITRLKPITYHVDIDKQEEIANMGRGETNGELIKPVKDNWEGKYDLEKVKMTGFFAQDVEEAAKSINYSFNGVYNPKNGGLLSLDYSAFVVPLVKAVQEQQTIIDKQQKQIDDLLKRIVALEKK